MKKIEYKAEIWLWPAWPARIKGKNPEQHLEKMEENQKRLNELIDKLPKIRRRFEIWLVTSKVEKVDPKDPKVKIWTPVGRISSGIIKSWNIFNIFIFWRKLKQNIFWIKFKYLDDKPFNQFISDNDDENEAKILTILKKLQAWQEKEIERQKILKKGVIAIRCPFLTHGRCTAHIPGIRNDNRCPWFNRRTSLTVEEIGTARTVADLCQKTIRNSPFILKKDRQILIKLIENRFQHLKLNAVRRD